jgi:predicted lipoprotein with Yx(FWY)xxD motif
MTDANGTAVYTFSGDKPGVSTCTGACAKTWIPVRSPGGKPQPGTGQTQSALGNIQRPDGSQQVTLNGLPLYYYAGDTAAGSAAGQGTSSFGGTWTAVAPPAAPSKTNATAPASPTK